MCCSHQERLRQQVRFLQRQFLQEGELTFTDVLSAEIVSQALTAAGVVQGGQRASAMRWQAGRCIKWGQATCRRGY